MEPQQAEFVIVPYTDYVFKVEGDCRYRFCTTLDGHTAFIDRDDGGFAICSGIPGNVNIIEHLKEAVKSLIFIPIADGWDGRGGV